MITDDVVATEIASDEGKNGFAMRPRSTHAKQNHCRCRLVNRKQMPSGAVVIVEALWDLARSFDAGKLATELQKEAQRAGKGSESVSAMQLREALGRCGTPINYQKGDGECTVWYRHPDEPFAELRSIEIGTGTAIEVVVVDGVGVCGGDGSFMGTKKGLARQPSPSPPAAAALVVRCARFYLE